MGEPGFEKSKSSGLEYIGVGSKLGEVNHLSTRRKRKKFDFLSSGERNGNSPNPRRFGVAGVVGPGVSFLNLAESCWKADPKRVKDP